MVEQNQIWQKENSCFILSDLKVIFFLFSGTSLASMVLVGWPKIIAYGSDYLSFAIFSLFLGAKFIIFDYKDYFILRQPMTENCLLHILILIKIF
ncbi:hypothetical protein A9239_08805 [Methanosarcina sp. A14]|nr:hypothetical protein A9239_08805 [Methanosarcina sp. A14]